MPTLTIALAKGRILDETLPLFAQAGIVADEDPQVSRKLILSTSAAGVCFLMLRASDVPLLVVDHKIDFLDRLCDRLVVLQLGRVVADGPPAMVWNDPTVVDAYLGRRSGAGGR